MSLIYTIANLVHISLLSGNINNVIQQVLALQCSNVSSSLTLLLEMVSYLLIELNYKEDTTLTILFCSIAVLEIMVTLLDSGDQDLVYFCCGVLVNFMLDEDKRPVLKREGGIAK